MNPVIICRLKSEPGGSVYVRYWKTRRSKNESISALNFLENGLKVISDDAFPITLSTFCLTGKTAYTSFIVEIVEVNKFGFRSLRVCSFQSFFKQHCSVPVLPRTSIKCNYLHGCPPQLITL